MRGIVLVVVLAVLGFVVYKYALQTGGAPAGIGGNVPNVDPNAIKGKASEAAQAFYRQPWFWTLAVSAVAATLGIMTWKRIGKWGQMAVVIAVAVAVTAWLTK